MAFTKLIISGNLYEYTNYQKDPAALSTPRKVSGRSLHSEPLFGVKRHDNLFRARSNAVRRMFTSAADHQEGCFVTFTFNEQYATNSIRVAGVAFSAFQKRMFRHFKNRYTIVAAPERHTSGRVHIHALLFGTKLLNERENGELARLWKLGNVDVKGRDLQPKLIFYISKYITKQEGDNEFSSRSFWSSHGIDKPIEIVENIAQLVQDRLEGVTISESSTRSVYFGIIKRKKIIRC